MDTINVIRQWLDHGLAAIVAALVFLTSLVIIIGFCSRLLGAPLSWTAEVGGVGLAWMTFYGSALAAGRGAHIASPSILGLVPLKWRVFITLVSEAFTIAFFIMLFWTGMQVVEILKGSNLVSLPFVPQQLTESALPIGAALFVLAEVLRLPELLTTVGSEKNEQLDDSAQDDVL